MLHPLGPSSLFGLLWALLSQAVPLEDVQLLEGLDDP